MADNFERVKSDILKRTAGNGGPTALDLLEAIEATNEDNDLAHTAIMDGLNAHLIQAEIFFDRVQKLEAYREDNEKNCARRIKALWKEEHDPVHRDHVAEMHKLDEEAYDIKKLYRTVRWAILILGGGILIIIADQIGNLMFGGAT